MTGEELNRWLKQVMSTQDEEISCTECFDLVSRFVDMELDGAPGGMPQVSQHLEQCRACREEYEILRDLRRLDDVGSSPSLDELRRSIH